MTGLPILLDLLGRRVVIVGGGTVAARRAKTFTEAGAEVLVIAPEVAAELATSGVEVARRRYRPGDLAQAWLAVTATDDPSVNAAVADEAAGSRIFCIRADEATAGTARVPAILHSGELTVSVNAGDDPRRAAELRNLIAAALETGELASRPVRPAGVGSVALVGGGPGDPELITVRGRRLLLEADVVVTDRLGATELLVTVPYDVEVINVGKSPDNHPVPQTEINRLLVEKAREGKTVVRLKGGDPFVFGRGGEEVNACIAAGVDVEVVPGVTSAIAVPALAGIPVTQRAVSNSVVITSGHAGADAAATAAMASGATAVFLMGVSALPEIVEAGLRAGASPSTPVAIIENGSTSRERVTRGELDAIVRISREMDVKPPAVIVIGEVAGPEFLGSAVAATS